MLSRLSRLGLIVLALGSATAAHAQTSGPLSKAAQITQLGSNCFPTQTTGAITPAITVTCLTSLVNSYQQFPGYNPQTGTTYTFQATDYGQLVSFNNSSSVAVTLPQAISSFYPWSVYVSNLGAGTVTITPQGGSTINGASTLALAQYQTAQIISDGTNYQVIFTSSITTNINVGVTNVISCTASYILYAQTTGGHLGCETLASTMTAGTGISITGTTNPTIANTGLLSFTPIGGGTAQTSSGVVTFASPGGSLNVLRNSSLSAWFHGCVTGSCTATTTAATTNWCAEGVFVIPTGANVTCQATATVPAGNPGYYALKITGASSNTDIKTRFVIESYSAAKIAGQTVTFQFTFINNSGASITPALSTKYPTTQDGGVTGGASWGASTTDLAATNLTACANGSTCTEAYTLAVNSSANLGYEFVVDFGAMASNSDTITLGAGFDARVTTGVATGINASPPLPEVLRSSTDVAWCERFYQASYDNTVAPGAASHLGMVGGAVGTASTASEPFVAFHTSMRATPTTAYWDGAGNASKQSTTAANGGTSFTDNVAPNSGPFNVSTKGFSWATASTATNGFIHYSADASLWGGP